jgi:predicted ester cyclase
VSESSEQSRELMRRITTGVWDEGRLELIDELIAEDLVDHIEVPGLEVTGRERYRANAVLTRTAFPDFRNPLDLIVADGDIAVSYGRMVGTNTGEMMGMPPTGKTIDVPSFGMLRFKDGQAVERWGVHDTMVMMQQLGAAWVTD